MSALHEQAVIPVADPKTFGVVRTTIENAFSSARVKDFLGPFVTALVLAASGELSAKNFDAIVVGARKNQPFHNTRSLACPSAEQARDYLSQLVGDLLTDPARLASAAPRMSKADRDALHRETGASWTPADVPLLDEAAELLGEDDRAARAAADA